MDVEQRNPSNYSKIRSMNDYIKQQYESMRQQTVDSVHFRLTNANLKSLRSEKNENETLHGVFVFDRTNSNVKVNEKKRSTRFCH